MWSRVPEPPTMLFSRLWRTRERPAAAAATGYAFLFGFSVLLDVVGLVFVPRDPRTISFTLKTQARVRPITNHRHYRSFFLTLKDISMFFFFFFFFFFRMCISQFTFSIHICELSIVSCD